MSIVLYQLIIVDYRPLPHHELLEKIIHVCGKDHTAVALTQEILVYLAMFIRSEPHLFHDMLRLRIGLIYNVMVTEVSRSLHCPNEVAVENLLSLGPFQLKNLLHHVLSRKEFTVDQITRQTEVNETIRQLSIVTASNKYAAGKLHEQVKALESGDEMEDGWDKHGQWRRRRRIDGALNRVPPDFYSKAWHTLEKCDGLFIGNKSLPKYPTVHEMTAGELKFALRVETVLNSLPDPEYRQLVVEVLMVVSLMNQFNPDQHISQVINVNDIIKSANELFLKDQLSYEGLSLRCCCNIRGSCGGYDAICCHFYDSSPSGVYGTMSYFSQALLDKLKQLLPSDQSCRIS
jgi:phosphorylase kinase alpha/beta subunit